MAILKYYVGIVGSGKTTVARQALREGELFLDSDEMREELFGDAACQDNPSLVFATMEKRTIEALNSGRNVVYVACNIWARKRINFLLSLKKKVPQDIIYECYIINCPIEIARERNSARARVVPSYVIDRQLRQFEAPTIAEGWDKIEIIDNFDVSLRAQYNKEIMDKVFNFGSQNNSNHSLSLADHCKAACNYADEHSFPSYLSLAAFLHDIGKAYTMEYWEKDNGENAHFPNHANVGAVLAMSMGAELRVIQLINYHMLHYTDEACQKTWRARLGEGLWHDLQLLNQADLAAH